jgi:hypothetical protein
LFILDTIENNLYNIIRFSAQEGRLEIEVEKSGFKTSMNLNMIVVYGVKYRPNKILINNENHLNFIYNDIDKVCIEQNLIFIFTLLF